MVTPPAARRPTSPRSGSRWRQVPLWLSIAVLVLSAISWAGFSHVTGSIKRQDVFSGLKQRPDRNAGNSINYLLVGSDQREGLTKEQLKILRVGSVATAAGKRSDTIILIHISKDRDRATIISIPRDTYAEIPEWTDSKGKVHSISYAKINEAIGRGDAPLLIATIEHMTNLRIDHYVEVNFAGFANLVDAVGGVDICTNTAIHDNKSHIDLAAGQHHMDGVTALKYVRARYFDGLGDLGRMKRQQKFIASLLKSATSSGVLLNPVRLLSVINAGLSTVTTDPDLTKDDLVTLATQLKSLSASNLQMMTVPLSNVSYDNNGVFGAVQWDPNLAPELWRRLRNDEPIAATSKPTSNTPTIAPKFIDISVANGTDINGLAAKAAKQLGDAGFVNSSEPATATTKVSQTTITYDPNFDESLKTLSAALPIAKLVAKKGQGKTFIITLGPDFKDVAKFTAPTGSPSPTPTATTPFKDVNTGADTGCK